MTVELALFVIFAALAIAGALAVVFSRNPIHSAIGLLATMVSLAVFYVVQFAQFVAMVQVIVYAGAVLTLFLFVIMFIGWTGPRTPRSAYLGSGSWWRLWS